MGLILYRHISELLTLEGVREKKGRHTTEKDLGIIEDAAVVVGAEKTVLWFGKTSELPKEYSKAKVIDQRGQSWIPSPVECHTHLVFAGSRAKEFAQRCTGLTYSQIAEKGGGILSTVRSTREASLEKLTDLARNRIELFRQRGAAAIEIKSGYGLDLKNELKMLKVIQTLKKEFSKKGLELVPTFLPAHAVPPEFKGRTDDYVKEICEEWIPEVAKQKLAVFFDAFVENGYFDIRQTEKMVDIATQHGLKTKLHVDQFNALGGADLAIELKATSADHLECVSENSIKRFGSSHTVAVLAPSASLFTKTAYAPARKLLDAGARLALTTDFNAGTSPTLNFGLVMTLACTQMQMTLPEAIAAMTYGAAAAIGREDELGSLQTGKTLSYSKIPAPYESWVYGFGEIQSAPI